jgi:phosphonopyruvate decarboxylase|eukprot:CAMPEP_0168317446 /NCGR_PEP_ID=MMETSP0210-20121227/25163_1 /TAXON_ID=40633 /ORGANISM="Condylostoma magnum, Strain COL2" /LENGTH=96 /DNA_ID=CAMNT_0008316439 /DNA_START=219 /DNA_END=509 /DNA_ORIENTATION=+
MNSMLADIGCTYEVLPDYEEGASAALDAAYYHLQKRNAPYAFLVRKRCFEEYSIKQFYSLDFEMSREDAIGELTGLIGKFDPVVSTTGFPSRELYE